MDLGTIEKNLRNNVYQTLAQFGLDVKKIWNNAMLYNPDGTDIYIMTQELSEYYEKIYKDVESDKNVHINELQRRVDRLTRELKDLHNSKGQKNLTKNTQKMNMDKPMSIQEKRQLGQNIRQLPAEHLRVICEIVSEGQDIPQDEIEIDIDILPPRKCRELERFVKSKLQIINKNKLHQNQSKKKGCQQPQQFYSQYQQQNSNQQQFNNFQVSEIKDQKFQQNQNQVQQQQQTQNQTFNQKNIQPEMMNELFQQEQMLPQMNQFNQQRIDPQIQSDSSFITESDESDNDI